MAIFDELFVNIVCLSDAMGPEGIPVREKNGLDTGTKRSPGFEI